MVRKNSTFFKKVLLNLIPVLSLPTSPIKKVSLRNDKVFTDVYVKSTDCHQHLHYLSVRPYHTKMSVVFSQTLRISKLCSSEKDFENHKEEMKSLFKKRKYPEDLISSEMTKVRFSNLRLKSNDKNHNMKGIPHHLLLKSVGTNIAKNKVFTPPAMVSFRSTRKLISYLVRAKLYPLERMVGSYKCKSKQYQVCNNITEADLFACSNDQTNFKINHRFECNERCLI